MTDKLAIMTLIQEAKTREMQNKDLMDLDAEGIAVVEHNRYTLDIVDTPVDPMR